MVKIFQKVKDKEDLTPEEAKELCEHLLLKMRRANNTLASYIFMEVSFSYNLTTGEYLYK